ncbi:Hydrogenase/urease nickel incorporation protein HypA [Rubripirellula tenax]|uniref:Hydrogenase maturation factor HypA n=1 Tax=Rubripirellula tenax TaxID=2528015 RepID=A0A5C6EN67_9BACT|nr:hydrogenase maturation nickel metallochaperone HypA [Rubripirellula tenax]TWU50572.1 Hydrogenase/urease nickel incorporation protein HypA [Rubripirellula tenax]
MHERSLVKSLLRQVEQIAAENGATEVSEVTVEIGPLSGIEIDLVRIAFDELISVVDLVQNPSKDGSLTRSTTPQMRLVIIESALAIECLRCHQESELNTFIFRCHQCGSGRVKVIAGDQFRLLSVTLAEGVPHAD